MKKVILNSVFFSILIFLISCNTGNPKQESTSASQSTNVDPLPSWNPGPVKQAILDFVTNTSTEGHPDFIPVADRIACFDNDGTLWSEQPYYFQLAFALDQIKAMAPAHPEWKTKEPFKSVLANDLHGVLAGGEKAIFDIVMSTHAGITTDSFAYNVTQWMKTATHPKTGKHYNEMIYQPMVELLKFLRDHGYRTYIVSGGGVDFMRPWTYQAYGIPPDQVVGSSGKVKYEVREGIPVLVKLPELNFIDDKEGKPVGIHQYIGKRPVIAVGNSDGDYAMLQYTTAGPGPRLGMLIHHTDGDREYAYDRESHIGKLEKGLDDAAAMKWKVVDMKKDWNVVFAK